jgi:alkylation response protein AidB-like acyl-CoA dehydrogenase
VSDDVRGELRAAVRGLLERLGGVQTARRVMDTESGYDAEIWSRLTAELGLPGLALSEDLGGQGATFAEAAVVCEELTRVLLPTPYLASAVLCANATSDRDVLEQIAAGTPMALCVGGIDLTIAGSTVSGRFDHVIDAAAADGFLVSSGRELVYVERSNAKVTATATVDQTRRQASVEFAGAPGRRVEGDVARAMDIGRVALAAECVAGAQRCLELTVDYAKVREQFGRPIGSFQALKHRMADMHVAVETAMSMADHAVWTVTTDAADLPLVAAAAKAHCADVYAEVAQETIQLHGGIGFTWEHDAHLHLKRAWSTRQLLGTPTSLRARVADLVGI